jgi:hypothetical protein
MIKGNPESQLEESGAKTGPEPPIPFPAKSMESFWDEFQREVER